MWRYSINNKKWDIVPPAGNIPSPREKFYCTEYFDLGIFLFGGKANEAYSDFYFFTISTESWDSPKYSGDLPGPRHSGCSVLWGNNVILIGGYNEAGITDEI